MYKKTVTYEELFSGRTVTRDFYFHTTQIRMARNLDIKDDLEAFEAKIAGEERDLTTAEKLEMLSLIERLVKITYGVRGEGEKFIQSDEVYEELVDTPAYDAIILSIFETDASAMEFMTQVMPKSVRDEIAKTMPKEDQEKAGVAIPPQRPRVPLDRLQKGGELPSQ